MKDYAKCALADMILKYIKDIDGSSEKEDDDLDEEDIFKEPKSKVAVKVKSEAKKA